MKMLILNKYKQSRGDVKCNLNVQLETDVRSDVKQDVKTQFVRHVQYNTST